MVSVPILRLWVGGLWLEPTSGSVAEWAIGKWAAAGSGLLRRRVGRTLGAELMVRRKLAVVEF